MARCSFTQKIYKKNKQVIQEIKSDLQAEYLKYEGIINLYTDSVPTVTFIGDDQKKTLIDYYEAPPKKLAELFQNRRNNNLKKCPYCANPLHPNTLDHFIPKNDYPHFSIFQNNLVPQCSKCASIKGEKYYDASFGCIFIHPFYSDILSRIKINFDIVFLTAINNINISNIIIKLENGHTMENERVKKHLNALDFKNRLQEYCVKQFGILRKEAKKNSFDLDLFINGKLTISAQNNRDWETAFYTALQANIQAITFLKKLMPKASCVGKIRSTEFSL